MNINSKSKKFFVGFNWKMNPNTLPEAKTLFQIYSNLNANPSENFLPIVFLPSIYINPIQEINSCKINLGSQDVSAQESGAFTGQISGQMLATAGIKYSLINHSETHRDFKLNFITISNKFIQALQNDIIPILCISFDKQESAKVEVENQLQNIFRLQVLDQIKLRNTTFYIALEPALNIGSGNALDCSSIDKYLEIITNFMTSLKLRKQTDYFTLYGGSVNSTNIIEIGNCRLVDGFLLGGASIDPDQVKSIFETLK